MSTILYAMKRHDAGPHDRRSTPVPWMTGTIMVVGADLVRDVIVDSLAAQLGAAKTPVSIAPRIPPIAVHAEHVERVVGAEHLLQPLTPHRHTTPASDPDDERAGDADEAAGRRDRDQARDGAGGAPSIDGLPLTIHSANIQDSTAAAVASSVLMNASRRCRRRRAPSPR